MKTIYTYGYGRDGSWAKLREALEKVDPEVPVFNVIDCRLTRTSRNTIFQGNNTTLASVFGFAYEWPHDDDTGKGILGNTGGPGAWKPPWSNRANAHVEAAAKAVHEGKTLVLMCCEKKPMVGTKRECHRVKVAEAVAALVPGGCEVVHL